MTKLTDDRPASVLTQYNTLQCELDDGVLTVALSRPEKLNAFTLEMGEELEALFAEVNERDDVRAVIVTGSGRSFCAGMELSGGDNLFGLDYTRTPMLSDLEDLDDPRVVGVRDVGGRMTLAIRACRKPVIAAINGPAVGIGATMTLAMDARLMSSKGRFGLVFGRLGIVPEGASTWFLPRIVGLDNALDLVFSADVLDADAAAEVGIVRSVHAPDELLAAARALADRWTKGRSQLATALSRQMLYRNSVNPVDAHRVESLGIFYTSSADAPEGIAAFVEKRSPNFSATASHMPPFYDDWVDRT